MPRVRNYPRKLTVSYLPQFGVSGQTEMVAIQRGRKKIKESDVIETNVTISLGELWKDAQLKSKLLRYFGITSSGNAGIDFQRLLAVVLSHEFGHVYAPIPGSWKETIRHEKKLWKFHQYVGKILSE